MNKIKFSFYFIFISILTLITVLVVLVQKSYTNLVSVPQSNIQSNTLLSPINPTLDLDVLTEIENRPESSTGGLIVEPENPITPTPVSTNSALIVTPIPN